MREEYVGAIVGAGLVMAIWAGAKGYSPSCWFMASGPIGMLIIMLMPSVKDHKINKESAARKKKGDMTGAILSGFLLVAIFVSLLLKS